MRFQPLFLVGTDVVFLLRKFARFTHDEAEKCRKYISKMMPKRFDYAERFVTGCMENPEFRVGTLARGDVARAEAERIWDELLKMEVVCFATLKAHDVSFTRLAYQIAYLKSVYFTELMFAREECRTASAESKVVGEFTLDKLRAQLEMACKSPAPGVARSIYAMTGSSRPYAASNATCLRSFTRQLCSSSSRPDL